VSRLSRVLQQEEDQRLCLVGQEKSQENQKAMQEKTCEEKMPLHLRTMPNVTNY
jgi:hypothetical protein